MNATITADCLFLSRAEYSRLVDDQIHTSREEWLDLWTSLTRSWSINGVSIHGAPEEIAKVRKLAGKLAEVARG